jgi:hypothetical protein
MGMSHDAQVLKRRFSETQRYAKDYPVMKVGLKIESFIGHTFRRRPPPKSSGLRLLNLGCGDQKFNGWVNADFYHFYDYFLNRNYIPDWMLDITMVCGFRKSG